MGQTRPCTVGMHACHTVLSLGCILYRVVFFKIYIYSHHISYEIQFIFTNYNLQGFFCKRMALAKSVGLTSLLLINSTII